jgi:hypothetical protein
MLVLGYDADGTFYALQSGSRWPVILLVSSNLGGRNGFVSLYV